MNENKRTEEFRVNGGEVWAKIKELVRAGNVRHLVFKDSSDAKIFSMTLSIAAIIAIIAPSIVVIVTIIALVMHSSIVIEKEEVVSESSKAE